ncbi:hypothetical protein THAOC_25739, partial [Thalassiosira oceanica]
LVMSELKPTETSLRVLFLLAPVTSKGVVWGLFARLKTRSVPRHAFPSVHQGQGDWRYNDAWPPSRGSGGRAPRTPSVESAGAAGFFHRDTRGDLPLGRAEKILDTREENDRGGKRRKKGARSEIVHRQPGVAVTEEQSGGEALRMVSPARGLRRNVRGGKDGADMALPAYADTVNHPDSGALGRAVALGSLRVGRADADPNSGRRGGGTAVLAHPTAPPPEEGCRCLKMTSRPRARQRPGPTAWISKGSWKEFNSMASLLPFQFRHQPSGPRWRQARAFSVGFSRVESFRERDHAEVEKAQFVVEERCEIWRN